MLLGKLALQINVTKVFDFIADIARSLRVSRNYLSLLDVNLIKQ